MAIEVEIPSSSLISRVENRLITSSSVAVLTMTPVERGDPSSSSMVAAAFSLLSVPSTMDQLLVVESSDMMFRKNALDFL